MTLVELMVAMAMSGLVLLGAVSVMQGVSDASGRLIDDAEQRESDAVGITLARALARRAEIKPGERRAFVGTPRRIEFRGWCESAGGWLARCVVVLELADEVSGRALFARWGDQEPIRLARFAADAHFAFRETAPNGIAWLTDWGEGIRAPGEVGLVSRSDTLLLAIGSER